MRVGNVQIGLRQVLYTILSVEYLILAVLRPAEMFIISVIALSLRMAWRIWRRRHAIIHNIWLTFQTKPNSWAYLHHRIHYPAPAYHSYQRALIERVQSGHWVLLLSVWMAIGRFFGRLDATTIWTPITRVPFFLTLTWATLGVWGLMIALVRHPTRPQILWESLLRYYAEFRNPRQHLMRWNWRLGVIFLVEIALICGVAYAATASYRHPDPSFQLSGTEAEWLTNSAYQSYYSLQRDGHIAEWNPWFEYGSPNIINPFSFVTNPISMLPSLIYGGQRGILYSVMIYTALAGIGGWYLGRVLGLSSVGRVALGLLLIGKGNMHAMLGAGHYQLAVSQAYIPWVVAGFIATIYYPHKRWPPVLTGVAFALQFMAGNIWFTLPTLFSMIALAIAHVGLINQRFIDWRVWRGWIFAALITVVVSAATLIPIWHYRELVLHPEYDPLAEVRPIERVLRTFWENDPAPYYTGRSIGYFAVYYSYIAPLWFLLWLFVYLPPIWPFLYRAAHRDLWRIWVVGALGVVFGLTWGAGNNYIIQWLYEKFDVLAQFRFKGRALGVATFWLAVLIAMRIDGLARVIYSPIFWRNTRRIAIFFAPQALFMAFFTFRMLIPSAEATRYFGVFGWAEAPRIVDHACLAWLRARYPDEQFAAYRIKYDATTAYIVHQVGMMPIEADYTPLPQPNTIGDRSLDFTRQYPRWSVVTDHIEYQNLLNIGYRPVMGAPTMNDLIPLNTDTQTRCLLERSKYYPYAYQVPLRYYDGKRFQKADPVIARPVEVLTRLSDTIELKVAPVPEPMIVQAQELAYPGWHAYMDDQPVDLEVLGGMIAVVIPPDGQAHTVTFRYHNQLYHQMAWLSVVGCLCLIAYLLRVDKRIKKMARH